MWDNDNINFTLQEAKALRTVAKTVQTWLSDIKYAEEAWYEQTQKIGEPLKFQLQPLADPYTFDIELPLMHKLSKKIELATNLNVTKRLVS